MKWSTIFAISAPLTLITALIAGAQGYHTEAQWLYSLAVAHVICGIHAKVYKL